MATSPTASGPGEAQSELRLRDRLAHLEQRERELSTLFEAAHSLASVRDVDGTLTAIVSNARQMMGADIAYLSVYDSDRGDFYVRATVGTISDRFRQIRVSRDTGICGHVARHKVPHYSSAYHRDLRFAHDRGIDEGVGGEGIESMLGVPLLVDDRVTGILFVADRYHREYTAPQIAFLASLAAHAAVAIENARLFEENALALSRERETNARLQAQTSLIQEAAAAHDQLTSLIARGGDLADLAGVIARELRGTVAIVDHHGHPLATAPEAAEHSPALPEQAAIRAAMAESEAVGRAVLLDGDPCRQVATAVGAQTLQGAIVLLTETALSSAQVRTLERSAVIAALVLLAEERLRIAEHRAMTDLVTELAKGHSADEVALTREAARYGVRFPEGVTLMAIEAPGVSISAATEIIRPALPGVPSLVGQYDGTLLVLANAAQNPRASAEAVCSAVAARARGPVTVVYTGTFTEPGEVPAVRDAAHRCLALQIALGREGDVEHDAALAPYALLFSARDRGALEAYIKTAIGEILEHDGRRPLDLAGTLLTYLDSGRDIKAAAQQLHLHPNTLRQRLRTVAKIAPHWDDPVHRLEVHMALRLHALRSGAVRAGAAR